MGQEVQAVQAGQAYHLYQGDQQDPVDRGKQGHTQEGRLDSKFWCPQSNTLRQKTDLLNLWSDLIIQDVFG